MICNTRLTLIGAFAAIGVVFQTVRPVIPIDRFEQGLLNLYGVLEPLVTSSGSNESRSRVAIVEIDNATIEALGWPIHRRHYRDMFAKLTANGRPWVLSLLHLQRLRADSATAESPDEDQLLADSMGAYGRVVGTGLDNEVGAELDETGEALLIEKSLLLENNALAEDLPYLPLQLREDPLFVASEVKFGLAPRFGIAPVVYCMPMFVPDRGRSGALTLPTGALYALGYASGKSIALEDFNRFWWDTAKIAQEDLATSLLVIEEKHCLRHTRTPTEAYLMERKVLQIPLIDLLNGPTVPDLKGYLVVLASSEGRKFRGPGVGSGDEVIAREHTLLARFLDGLMTSDTTRYKPLALNEPFAIYPIVISVILILATLFLKRVPLVVLVFASFLVPASEGLFNLSEGALAFPVQGAAAGASACVFSFLVLGVRRLLLFREVLAFNVRLREACAHVNSLLELQIAAKGILRLEVPHSHLYIGDFDEEFYRLPADPSDLVDHVARVSERYRVEGPLAERRNMTMSLTQIIYPFDRYSTLDRKAIVSSATAILRQNSILGRTKALARVDDWGLTRARRLLEAIGAEIRLHWGRIELLQAQKFSEYRRLIVAQELEMGQAVQGLMLPKNLSVVFGSYEFLVIYRPYGSMAGDWVQTHVSTGKGPTVLAIGDVVGKGASAALITSAIAAAWHQYRTVWEGLERGNTAAITATVADLDRMIRQLFGGKQYTTLSLAVVWGDQVEVLSAGAPPWLHLKIDGSIATLRTKATNPLGLVTTSTFEPMSIRLSPGETLFAHSDGVMESSSARLRFKASFAAEVTRTPLPAFGTIANLAIEAGERDVLPDDMSLLMLRRTVD